MEIDQNWKFWALIFPGRWGYGADADLSILDSDRVILQFLHGI
jgi:hypothetical protein